MVYEKAFDSLDWNFIHKCLSSIGLKDDFCKWIKIIYTEPKAFLKINGYISEKIMIEQGIRQGCPISCLIFIICTEFMALKIKQSEEVKGIDIQTHLGKRNLKVTQYADDTCLFLRNKSDVNAALKVLESFTAVSGLHLNLSKTKGLGIGTLKDMNTTADSQIKWTQTPI